MNPLAVLKRCETTEWRDYAVYEDEQGQFLLDGKRVRIESVYCVPSNMQPRWLVTLWGDDADRKAVNLIGATPFDTKTASIYGWNK